MMTPEQKARVEFIVNERFVDEELSEEEMERKLAESLAAIESTEELHHVAANYNWDCGVETLRKLIANPLCDAGTALLLYWRANPDYWYRSPARREALTEDVPPELALVREIEERYLHGLFASQTIRIDPQRLDGEDAVAYYHRHRREDDQFTVPEEMKVASPGVEMALDEIDLD